MEDKQEYRENGQSLWAERIAMRPIGMSDVFVKMFLITSVVIWLFINESKPIIWILISLLYLAVLWFQSREMFSKIIIDEKGVEVKDAFKKQIYFCGWDEIKQFGTTKCMGYRWLYFTHELVENEAWIGSCLYKGAYRWKEIIHMRYSPEDYERIKEMLERWGVAEQMVIMPDRLKK